MATMTNWPPLSHWPLEGRELDKPRKEGVTMVFDKGLGPSAFQDLLELGGEFVDFIKIGFGSMATYRWEQFKEKVIIARRYGVEVYPGGTMTEIAYIQDRYDHFLDILQQSEVHWVEISDGTIHLTSKERRQMINKARQRGFNVLTEVGKKDPKKHLAMPLLVQQAIEDLSDGAAYVIMEGRESGKGVNLYDQDGKLKEDDMETLLSHLPKNSPLLWEAPLKNQQESMIIRFGPNVNLGNIAPADVIAVECLRRGLRSDTLKNTLGKRGSARAANRDRAEVQLEESHA